MRQYDNCELCFPDCSNAVIKTILEFQFCCSLRRRHSLSVRYRRRSFHFLWITLTTIRCLCKFSVLLPICFKRPGIIVNLYKECYTHLSRPISEERTAYKVIAIASKRFSDEGFNTSWFIPFSSGL